MNPTHDPKKCISLYDFCEALNKLFEQNGVIDMSVLEHGYMKCMDFSIKDARKYRLTREEFSVDAKVTFGSNEGIYVDVYLDGKWRDEQKENGRLWIGCYKTLGESRKDAEAMGKMAGAISYFAHKYVGDNIEDFMGGGKGKEG